MVRKRFQETKTGIEYLKSVDYDKYLRKVGVGKEDHYFWKQIGKALLCTYTLIGAVWVYNETSPLGWWTLKPKPKEERELAHLYDRREFPYPGDEEAMEEFVAKGGMIGTTIGPKGTVETDKDSYNFQKQLQEKKFEQEAQKLWFRMRNEVIQELQDKGMLLAIMIKISKGMALLTMSATVHGLKPKCYSKDHCQPTSGQSAVTFLALYLIALGTGGIKPCVSSYGADQFDDDDETEKRHKSSFFNWFYLSINVGALIAGSVLVWVQDNVSWGWGFGIPTIAMAIAVVSFFSGTKLFRYQKPGGSPLTRICQVLVASFRKKKAKVPADKALLHETADAESDIKGSRKLDHTEGFSFLDKAAVETEKDDIKGTINPWNLCTVTQVEELKAIIRLLPVWATGIIFSAVYSQMGNLFVLQGETMDRYIGNSTFKIPSASLSIFDTLSVIFWVPVYDRIIVPVARKLTGHKNGLTQLQRMGIGLFISIFAMVSAAILELKRLQMVRDDNYYEHDSVPMSIFWQVPQYFLIGCAEVFIFIGQLEFFYEQAPDAMRSMCSALSLTTVALGNYLSSLLVTIVTSISTKNGKVGWIPDNLNYGHIDYFFWLLGILSVLNLGVYLWISRWYTYKKSIGTVR